MTQGARGACRKVRHTPRCKVRQTRVVPCDRVRPHWGCPTTALGLQASRAALFPDFRFTPAAEYGIIMAFSAERPRAIDIVRELTGSVKPLREGRHPPPPSDVAIQIANRCKSSRHANVGSSRKTILAEETRKRFTSLRISSRAIPTACVG